jgi:four helix bundle protein
MSGSYRDLKVWQKSLELTLEVYRGTQHFPREEVYGLTNQMRRAAVSVSSNIAEGKGRSSDRDFGLFLCHARGSLHELETQALIAEELGYIGRDAARQLEALTVETGKMLNGLIGSVRSREKGKGFLPTCQVDAGRPDSRADD